MSEKLQLELSEPEHELESEPESRGYSHGSVTPLAESIPLAESEPDVVVAAAESKSEQESESERESHAMEEADPPDDLDRQPTLEPQTPGSQPVSPSAGAQIHTAGLDLNGVAADSSVRSQSAVKFSTQSKQIKEPVEEQKEGNHGDEERDDFPTSVDELAKRVSSKEQLEGRPCITCLDLISWNEASFDELLREFQPKLPITVRVRLAKEHHTLATIGMPKPTPAPGYANLTEDAVEALRDQFKKKVHEAGNESLSEKQVMEFFEEVGIADEKLTHAAALEIATTPKTPTASARDHLTWFFQDIDVKRDGKIDWVELITYIDSLHSDEVAFTGDALERLERTSLAPLPDSLNDSAWISHLCLIVCATAILVAGAVYFRFVLVPLTLAWFLSFIVGSILDVLEQRPLVLCGYSCCTPKEQLKSVGKQGERYLRCCRAQPVAEVKLAEAARLTKMKSRLDKLESKFLENPDEDCTTYCERHFHKFRLKYHETSRLPMLYQAATDLFMLGKIPHAIAVLLAVLIFFGAIFLIMGKCVTEVIELGRDEEFVNKVEELGGTIAKEIEWALGVTVEELREFESEYGLQNTTTSVVTLAELQEQYGDFFVMGNDAMVMILLLLYILGDRTPLDHRLEQIKMNRKDLLHTLTATEEIHLTVQTYIMLKTLISAVTAALVMTTFLVCNVRLAWVFGVLTFLLNFIPNVGSLIAIVLPIPIILVDDGLTATTKIVAIVIPTIVQGLVGNGLEPMLFGASLNLSPISILIALVMYSAMWGLPGAILAVPLLAITRIVLHRTDHPVAKRALTIIRDKPMDEKVALQKKREAMFRPMRRAVETLADKRKHDLRPTKSRLSKTKTNHITQNVSCCWVEYKMQEPDSQP